MAGPGERNIKQEETRQRCSLRIYTDRYSLGSQSDVV